MAKVTAENYKDGYNRLFSWLRAKHPDIMAEYRADIQADFERVKRIREQSLQ